jgi:hypothetical protein
MNKVSFGAAEVLILSGAAIIIAGNFTPGVIFASLGVVAASFRFSLKYQQDKEEAEARQKIYDDIKAAATGGVQSVQNIVEAGSKFLH